MLTRKQALIQRFLQEYDIETAEDIQDALKDLLARIIQGMLGSEMNYHLDYERC